MRRIVVLMVMAVVGMFAIAACGGSAPTAHSVETHAQNMDSFLLTTNQPVPIFNHSQIRQELIDIETAQANGVQSTTFFMPNVGPPEGSCSSIGAPVAATTELTNPQQVVYGGGSSPQVDRLVVSQMDPNGVYSGNSTGTYVMCVNPTNGQVYAQYWEGYVRVVFGPAVWDSATNSPKLIGNPTHLFNNIKSQTP